MSQQPQVDRDGFPIFDREPVQPPELPERASPLELARAYATVCLLWCREWPRMIDAIYWLRGATMAAKAEAEAARREAQQAKLAVRSVGATAAATPATPRNPDSSYHEFDPAVATLRQVMAQRVKNAEDPMTEEQAVAFIDRVLTNLRQHQELQHDAAQWRKVKGGAKELALEVLKYAIGPLLLGAAWLWHWLVTHQ